VTRAVATALASGLVAACSPSPRDVVPESRDVRAAPSAHGSEDYVYVARRPHGAIALAEARHMSDGAARAIVDRLADELERCASDLDAKGLLVLGAVRVVAVASDAGVPVLSVRLAPGDAVAQNALLCIVAPMRAMALPPSTEGRTPGLAIESTWGPAKGAGGAL
jgi:hypothetical protein